KEDLVKVAEIICQENPSVTENSNGIFMFFHKFSNDTYIKLEEYVDQICQRDKSVNDSDSCSTPTTYYSQEVDDFPSQDGISPKLKFSNKEKNVVKRRRYD